MNWYLTKSQQLGEGSGMKQKNKNRTRTSWFLCQVHPLTRSGLAQKTKNLFQQTIRQNKFEHSSFDFLRLRFKINVTRRPPRQPHLGLRDSLKGASGTASRGPRGPVPVRHSKLALTVLRSLTKTSLSSPLISFTPSPGHISLRAATT